jgi:hypothetical protein
MIEMMQKTFEEIKGEVHDLSGIENPNDYLYDNDNSVGVYYPVKKISQIEIPFKKGDLYTMDDIDNFAYENDYSYNQYGNHIAGEKFIKLYNEFNNGYVISFVLTSNYDFECIYNDFE